jgi:hypothetical protein
MVEPILAFDRMILRAYLDTPDQPGRAQAVCRAAGLKLTAANLARVLCSLQRLEAAARALHAERTS